MTSGTPGPHRDGSYTHGVVSGDPDGQTHTYPMPDVKPERFVEVEVTVGPYLRDALLDAGLMPDAVLVAPVHTWFPFSSPDVIRVQFEVETRCQGCEDAPTGQHTGPHDWEAGVHRA